MCTAILSRNLSETFITQKCRIQRFFSRENSNGLLQSIVYNTLQQKQHKYLAQGTGLKKPTTAKDYAVFTQLKAKLPFTIIEACMSYLQNIHAILLSRNNWFSTTPFLWTKCTITICSIVCFLACLASFSSFLTIAYVNYIAFKIKTSSNESCFQRSEILSSSRKPDKVTQVWKLPTTFPLLFHIGKTVSRSHAREF